MTDAPQRIAVIGAGIIGSAVGRQLALLGAQVWLVDRADRAEANQTDTVAVDKLLLPGGD